MTQRQFYALLLTVLWGTWDWPDNAPPWLHAINSLWQFALFIAAMVFVYGVVKEFRRD